MSSEDDAMLRDLTRDVLAELLPELLSEALATPSANGDGHRLEDAPPVDNEPAVPQVPAPPIAKVHRPSGWVAPVSVEAASQTTAPAPDEGAIERVALRNDADLEAFVRKLARRLANPRERAAILSGKVRFRLAGASAVDAPAGSVVRIESGAVTERAVKEAAKTGARLVLSPRAVLTPMARDRARSLGVEIEKESPC